MTDHFVALSGVSDEDRPCACGCGCCTAGHHLHCPDGCRAEDWPRASQPHCDWCGCDLHGGACPEGHPSLTDLAYLTTVVLREEGDAINASLTTLRRLDAGLPVFAGADTLAVVRMRGVASFALNLLGRDPWYDPKADPRYDD